MFLLGGTEVYQEHVCLSRKFKWRYLLISTTCYRNFRLIKRFRAENQNFQNGSFSNFDVKFLFRQCSDSVELFLRKSRFLLSIGNLKNIAGIALSVPGKTKKPKISVIFSVFRHFFFAYNFHMCFHQFCLSYSTSPGIFTLESRIFEKSLVGRFF